MSNSTPCLDCTTVPNVLVRGCCRPCYQKRYKRGDTADLPKADRRAPRRQVDEKACYICKIVKPAVEFARQKRNSDGLSSYCKPCCMRKYNQPRLAARALLTPPVDGEQCCRHCKVVKPLACFYWRADAAKHASICIECRAEIDKAKRRNDPTLAQRARARLLMKKYAITTEGYDALLAKQNGTCAICGGSELREGAPLAVDHCHTTGRIRGLLCANCNRAIGLFADDPARLERGADYLRAR